jgi:hypothetical protein
MTDLITRARKEWCEPPVSEATITHYGTKIITTPTGSLCPRSVVSALLDLLKDSVGPAYCAACGKLWDRQDHTADCPAGIAEAAITRALEGKPCS